MLPVYRAISFQAVMSGGRTKPWLVLVDEGGTPKPYVVKLFTEDWNDSREAIANEVVGNILAKEFSLLTPKAALIDLDVNFEMTIYDDDARITYEHSDSRVKFGCAEIKDPFLYRMGMFSKQQIQSRIEIDNLFAFDTLIRNGDRGQIKPNLLLKKNDAYLIDHELGFNIDNTTFQKILDKDLSNYHFEHHIFYDYLKRSIKKTKLDYFNEFEENLRFSNYNLINSYLDQLNNYGYNTSKHRIVVQYLNTLKNNSSIFVDLLRGMIS